MRRFDRLRLDKLRLEPFCDFVREYNIAAIIQNINPRIQPIKNFCHSLNLNALYNNHVSVALKYIICDDFTLNLQMPNAKECDYMYTSFISFLIEQVLISFASNVKAGDGELGSRG